MVCGQQRGQAVRRHAIVFCNLTEFEERKKTLTAFYSTRVPLLYVCVHVQFAETHESGVMTAQKELEHFFLLLSNLYCMER